MTILEIRDQMESLIDNAKSFLDPKEQNDIWANDIEACTEVNRILAALQAAGLDNAEDAVQWIEDRRENWWSRFSRFMRRIFEKSLRSFKR